MESAEEDRRHVARELHDDIGQRLALLADNAERLRFELKLADHHERGRLDNLVLEARNLAEDLRRISHQLHPSILEDLGLGPALRALVVDFSDRTGLPVRFTDSYSPRQAPLNFATALYRITQEALRNIFKHAGQTTVEVSLDFEDEKLILVVADAGVGFAPSRSEGLGLTSMRERASLVGGSITIVSMPAKGTTIRVQLPLPETATI